MKTPVLRAKQFRSWTDRIESRVSMAISQALTAAESDGLVPLYGHGKPTAFNLLVMEALRRLQQRLEKGEDMRWGKQSK